ncbi:P4 [Pseudomonas phage phi2954]|uniref:p4 n=1 Tax=Pseudomonas phage phi2954 TaxID=593131 RepID=C0KIT8_9VIRU|nr:P4 [Pseudomonas phage phi2954]ACM91123.1 P4 [Pseudomonas phage phi2954]
MKMLPGELTKLRQMQHNAYHKAVPGAWFDMMTDIIAKTEKTELESSDGVLSINLANGKPILFDKTGAPVRDEQGEYVNSTHRGWTVAITSQLTPGCVPCVGEVLGARIGSGVLVAVGKGNSAKTPFAYALAEEIGGEDGYEVIRLGEPLSGYNTDLEAATFEIVHAIMNTKVIVLDSIKDVLGNAAGNATSSGISRGAFQFLSDLGSIAASRGCIIIIPVNPSSSDPKIEDLMIEASKSNATMVAVGKDDSWNILGRTGEGLIRTSTVLATSFDPKTLLMTLSGTTTKRTETVASKVAVQTVIANGEFEQMVHRLTR